MQVIIPKSAYSFKWFTIIYDIEKYIQLFLEIIIMKTSIDKLGPQEEKLVGVEFK